MNESAGASFMPARRRESVDARREFATWIDGVSWAKLSATKQPAMTGSRAQDSDERARLWREKVSWQVVNDTLNPNELSSKELVIRIAQGDATAFEAMYDRFASDVMGVAYKVTRDRAAAEEVVQETFWRVWCRADEYDARKGNPKTWVTSIARNLAIDVWRKRIRSQPMTHEDTLGWTEMQQSSNRDVSDETWIAVRHAEVRQAISELPPEQRDVIQQSYYHGKTRREIAAEQDIPVGTIHTRARLALQKLRTALHPEGVEE